jgi:hypothetical protein
MSGSGRFSVVALLVVAGALAAPARTLASCVLPNYPAFLAEPNAAIIGGRILKVTPQSVTVSAERWWGPGATPVVVIARPPTDPNVISSVDWNPQPGEPWIILAHLQGVGMKTEVCGQWGATAEALGEVAAAAGPGVVPAEVRPTANGADLGDSGQLQPDGSSPTPTLVIALVALTSAGAVVAFAFLRTRRNRAG